MNIVQYNIIRRFFASCTPHPSFAFTCRCRRIPEETSANQTNQAKKTETLGGASFLVSENMDGTNS